MSSNIILANDFETFAENLEKYFPIVNFCNCNLRYSIYKKCKGAKLVIPEALEKWHNNIEFMLLHKFLCDYEMEIYDYDKKQELCKKDMQTLSNEITTEEIQQLLTNIATVGAKFDSYCFQTSFEILLGYIDDVKFIATLNVILAVENLNFSLRFNKLIERLILIWGISKTKTFVSNCKFQKQSSWICEIYNQMPENELTPDIVREFLESALDAENKFNSCCAVEFDTIILFEKYHKGFAKAFLKMIACAESAEDYIAMMLYRIILEKSDSKLDFLLDHTNRKDLHKLYLTAISTKYGCDFNGRLLKILVEQDEQFIIKWVDVLFEKRVDHNFKTNVIWEFDNYASLLTLIFKHFQEKYHYVRVQYFIEKLFCGNSNEQGNFNKQLDWLVSFIESNLKDSAVLEYFLATCNFLPRNVCKMIILELCRQNASIELFKKCPFECSSNSWSGSEVPVINAKIAFLEDISGNLKGINFIEHKQYISELIAEKKEYKQRIAIREFLEDR